MPGLWTRRMPTEAARRACGCWSQAWSLAPAFVVWGRLPLPRTQDQPPSSSWAQARLTDLPQAWGKAGPGLAFLKRLLLFSSLKRFLISFLRAVTYSSMTISLTGLRTRNIHGTLRAWLAVSLRPHPPHSIPRGALNQYPL